MVVKNLMELRRLHNDPKTSPISFGDVSIGDKYYIRCLDGINIAMVVNKPDSKLICCWLKTDCFVYHLKKRNNTLN